MMIFLLSLQICLLLLTATIDNGVMLILGNLEFAKEFYSVKKVISDL